MELETAGYEVPNSDDIPRLIDCFSKDELMPQFFDEQKPFSSDKKKMLSFTNPSTNQTVFFRSDRIVVSWAMNPLDEEALSVNDFLGPFLNFVEKNLRAFEETVKGELSANRVSLVGNFVVPLDKEPADSHLQDFISSELPWCGSKLNEMNIRTGQTEKVSGFDEEVNAVVHVNDGTIEINEGGDKRTRNCFLVVLDLNTKSERQDFRFDINSAVSIWESLSSATQSKSEVIKDYLII